MPKTRWAAINGVILIAATVCGCESGADTANEPEWGASSDGAGTPSPGSVPPPATAGVPLPEDTPLAPYRPYLDGPSLNVDEQAKMIADAHQQREAVVAQCMSEAGFEYHPIPYPGSTTDTGQVWVAEHVSTLFVPELSADRTQVEKWGYGVDPDDYYTQSDEDRDPQADVIAQKNLDYMNSLSNQGRQAYLEALGGPGAVDDAPFEYSLGGCQQTGYDKVPEPPNPNSGFQEQHADLVSKMITLTRMDVPMDPKSVVLNREWNSCMSDHDIDVSRAVAVDAAGNALSDSGYMNQATPAVAWEFARHLGPDDSQWLDGDQALLRAGPAQVQVALADWDCRERTDYIGRLLEVQIAAEQRFLEQNYAQLEAMKEDASPPDNNDQSDASFAPKTPDRATNRRR